MRPVLPDPVGWSGRRVFLTGHTGFKGGWLALWLESMGAEVAGYALAPPAGPSLFSLTRKPGHGPHATLADIRDAAALREAMTAFAPHTVFHLAAQPLVRQGYEQPVETFHTNVLGTVNVLEAVRACPSVGSVVVITSDKCYLNREWAWGYREDEPLGGHDPYSASKGCTELVVASYRQSFFETGADGARGPRIATARAGNVIGGGDRARDRLVPDILADLAAGRRVRVRSPKAVRPWQHVLEPLAGYLLLAERLAGEADVPPHRAFNFGPDEQGARTVEWIVERLCRAWQPAGDWYVDAAAGPHEAHLLKLDSSRARGVLGWAPVWTLERTLQHIVAWQRAWQEGGDMRAFTLAQIDRYLEDARGGGPDSTPERATP